MSRFYGHFCCGIWHDLWLSARAVVTAGQGPIVNGQGKWKLHPAGFLLF